MCHVSCCSRYCIKTHIADISIRNGPHGQCFPARKRGESRSNWNRNNRFSVACKCSVMARVVSRSGSCYERDRISSRGTGTEQCKKEIENGEAVKRWAQTSVYTPRVERLPRKRKRIPSLSHARARLRRLIFAKARSPTRNMRNDRSGRHLLLLDPM